VMVTPPATFIRAAASLVRIPRMGCNSFRGWSRHAGEARVNRPETAQQRWVKRRTKLGKAACPALARE
jgi:hypothetical protein